MFSDPVVIHLSHRKQMLKQFHSGHPWISRRKALTSKIDQQIETIIKSCTTIPKLSPKKFNFNLKQVTHMDYAVLLNDFYHLIIADSFTKSLKFSNTRKETISSTVRELFARFEVPENFMMESGTHFVSASFELFSKANEIEQIPPSLKVQWTNRMISRQF